MPKSPFSNAPNFTLPGVNGEFRLSDLEGRNRVALLFPRDESQARAAIARFEYGIAGWKERDLILLLILTAPISELKSAPPGVFIAHDEVGEVAQRFGVSKGETAFFLLGKSHFPVALAVDYLPDDAEIFALIDAMPMRQREMRARLR